MHPTISEAIVHQKIEDAQRLARERGRVAELGGIPQSRIRRGFSRYFSHAREGHVKSVRRTHPGAGGAGARLT